MRQARRRFAARPIVPGVAEPAIAFAAEHSFDTGTADAWCVAEALVRRDEARGRKQSPCPESRRRLPRARRGPPPAPLAGDRVGAKIGSAHDRLDWRTSGIPRGRASRHAIVLLLWAWNSLT